MLKIGVLGAGNLAKIHIQLILELNEMFELVGFYEPDDSLAVEVAEAFNITRFSSYEELLSEIDCIDIVTPIVHHYELASVALRKSKHIFIEKPVTQTVDEAKSLLNLSREASVKVQVGSIKRFNPAFVECISQINRPNLIESRHLVQFNSISGDTFSVMELLMHDIDVVLSIARSGIRKISTSGVSVFSEAMDIINVRIEFDNGCVATLTAGRVAQENKNDVHIYQKGSCINVNFLTNEMEVVRMGYEEETFNALQTEKPFVEDLNPIREELKSFYQSIVEDKNPIISLEEGCESLIVLHQILERVNHLNVAITDNN